MNNSVGGAVGSVAANADGQRSALAESGWEDHPENPFLSVWRIRTYLLQAKAALSRADRASAGRAAFDAVEQLEFRRPNEERKALKTDVVRKLARLSISRPISTAGS